MDIPCQSLDNPTMKWLFDLFPVILFFAAYKLAGLYTATAVAIAATFVQIGWLRLRGRTIEPALWLSLGVMCGGVEALMGVLIAYTGALAVMFAWRFASGRWREIDLVGEEVGLVEGP